MIAYMLLGSVFGFLVGVVWYHYHYHEVLKSLIRIRTPEKVGDKFYYLVEESEYNRSKP